MYSSVGGPHRGSCGADSLCKDEGQPHELTDSYCPDKRKITHHRQRTLLAATPCTSDIAHRLSYPLCEAPPSHPLSRTSSSSWRQRLRLLLETRALVFSKVYGRIMLQKSGSGPSFIVARRALALGHTFVHMSYRYVRFGWAAEPNLGPLVTLDLPTTWLARLVPSDQTD